MPSYPAQPLRPLDALVAFIPISQRESLGEFLLINLGELMTGSRSVSFAPSLHSDTGWHMQTAEKGTGIVWVWVLVNANHLDYGLCDLRSRCMWEQIHILSPCKPIVCITIANVRVGCNCFCVHATLLFQRRLLIRWLVDFPSAVTPPQSLIHPAQPFPILYFHVSLGSISCTHCEIMKEMVLSPKSEQSQCPPLGGERLASPPPPLRWGP